MIARPLLRRYVGGQHDEDNGLSRREESLVNRFKSYWTYSLALAMIWAVTLLAAWIIHGPERWQPFVLVFAGFCIGWVSTTIARFVYPPPRRWRSRGNS